jgi:hypothetical protein
MDDGTTECVAGTRKSGRAVDYRVVSLGWLNSNKGTRCEIGIKKSKAVPLHAIRGSFLTVITTEVLSGIGVVPGV